MIVKTGKSYLLLADDVGIHLPSGMFDHQMSQLLLYLLSLLLVAAGLENIHSSLQVHLRVPDSQTTVDCSQQFQSTGQLKGLPEHLLLKFSYLKELSDCFFVSLAFQESCCYFSSGFDHLLVVWWVEFLIERSYFLDASESTLWIIDSFVEITERGVQFSHFFRFGVIFIDEHIWIGRVLLMPYSWY